MATQWRVNRLNLTLEPSTNSDVPIIYGRQGDVNPVRLEITLFNGASQVNPSWFAGKKIFLICKATNRLVRTSATYVSGSLVSVGIPREVFNESGLVPECYLSVEDDTGNIIVAGTSTFRIYVHSGFSLEDVGGHYIEEIDVLLSSFKNMVGKFNKLTNSDVHSLMKFLEGWKSSLDDLYRIDAESTKYLTQIYTTLQASVNNTLSRAIVTREAGSITYAMLAQDVRTAITGGSTAVVGRNAITNDNVVDGALQNEKLDRAAVNVHFVPDPNTQSVALDTSTGILSFGTNSAVYWNNTYLRIPAGTEVDLKNSFSTNAGIIHIDLTSGNVSARTMGTWLPSKCAIIGTVLKNQKIFHIGGAISPFVTIDGVRQGAAYTPTMPAFVQSGPNGYLSYDPVAKTITVREGNCSFVHGYQNFQIQMNQVIPSDGATSYWTKLIANFKTREAKIVNWNKMDNGEFVEVARMQYSNAGRFDTNNPYIRLYHRSPNENNYEFYPSANGLPYYDPARRKINWLCIEDRAFIKYNDKCIQLASNCETDTSTISGTAFALLLNPETGEVTAKGTYAVVHGGNEMVIGGGRIHRDGNLSFWGVPVFTLGQEISHAKENGIGGGAMAVAHRGYNRTMPEQGADSYIMAASYGIKAWECDIQFTKDNVPVLFHDDTINRIARTKPDGLPLQSPVSISQLTYAQLDNYDWGVYKSPFFKNSKILTFDGYCRLMHLLGVEKSFTELKTRLNSAQAQILIKIVDKWNLRKRNIWMSFNKSDLDVFKPLDDTSGMAFLGANHTSISWLNDYKNGKRDVWAAPSHYTINEKNARTLIDNGFKLYLWTLATGSNVNQYKNVPIDAYAYDGGFNIATAEMVNALNEFI